MVVDDSDSEKVMADLERLKVEYEKEKMVNAFLSDSVTNLSHSMQSPAENIAYLSKTLKDQSANVQEEYVERIAYEASRIMQMTQAIIDNNRLSRGVVRPNLQEINFVRLIENPSIKSLVEIAAQQGLSFSFEISNDVPDIIADPGLLLQALLNLMENAINFTEKGSISVKIYKSGKNVRIDVADSGIGISKDEKSYIFKRFQQGSVKSNKTHIGSGVGLGLSITKEIVNLHGGKVGVISEEGKGSTFWFILPYAPRITKKRSA